MLARTPTPGRGSQGLAGSGTSATCPDPHDAHGGLTASRWPPHGRVLEHSLAWLVPCDPSVETQGTTSPQRPPEAWRQGRHVSTGLPKGLRHPCSLRATRRTARRAGARHSERPAARGSGRRLAADSAAQLGWAPSACSRLPRAPAAPRGRLTAPRGSGQRGRGSGAPPVSPRATRGRRNTLAHAHGRLFPSAAL